MSATLPLADRTIAEVGELLRRREVSSRDLTRGLPGTHRPRRGAAQHLPGRWRGARAGRGRPRGRKRSKAGEGAQPPPRHPVRAQGHLRDPRPGRRRAAERRPADHRRLAHPGGLPLRLRLGRRGSADEGRCRPARQDQPRRVRDGLEQREQRLRPGPQPLGRHHGAGRQQRRIGRGGGIGPGLLRHRDRYRRQHPPACLALRDRGIQADLRAGEPIRDGRLRLVPRPVRPARPLRRRCGGGAPGAGRARPARLDQRRHSGARLRRRADRRGARAAAGRPARVLRGGDGARGRGGGALRHRRHGGPRRRDRRGLAALHRPRAGDLLHHHPGRGERQPGPIRRHPLRPRAPATTTCSRTTCARAAPASGRRSSAASSWAPTRCRPATTTPTTSRPSRCGP